jgi:surface antigen
MRLAKLVLILGLAAAAPFAAWAQAPKVTVEATPKPDVATLTQRAVELLDQGEPDLAIATAAKGATAAERDEILAALAENRFQAAEVPAAFDIAARLEDLEARRSLIGHMIDRVMGYGTGDTDVAAVPSPDVPPVPTAPDPATFVRPVQQALKDLGYDIGTVDGVIGRRTTAAISAFQTVAGLPVDGQVSDGLSRALGDAVADTTYIHFGTEAAMIGAPFTNKLRGRLREADIREAGAAFSFGLEGLAAGEQVTWRSTRASGEITMGDRFDRDGRACRHFTHRIRIGELSETATDVVACKQPSLGWLLDG